MDPPPAAWSQAREILAAPRPLATDFWKDGAGLGLLPVQAVSRRVAPRPRNRGGKRRAPAGAGWL
jgi:hypothetical protein